MQRINILLILLIALMTFSCGEKEEQKPNIIVFLVDDMGWQDTSVPFWTSRTPFNDRYKTPGMERLASQGMKFTQAYATPVCSPTRVSLITGMNAARHRVTNWTLRFNASNDRRHDSLDFPAWNVNGLSPESNIERTVYATPLPQLLKEAGYFTIHSGKAHFGAISTPGENPSTLGFDINIAGHAAGAPQSYYGTKNFGNLPGNENSPWPVPGLEKYHGQDIFLTEALTLEANLAIDSALNTDKPFFLYMAHYAVHTPIQQDDRFFEKYLQQGLDTIEARYASMVEGMDKSLGDIMDHIEKRGVSDNTIILFMSDNGGLSAGARGGERHTHNKPLSSGKGSAHEGGIREPMLVKWPGTVTPGSINDQYLIIEDFFPTILEMAEIQNYNTVQTVDGQSFVPFLKDATATAGERPLIWHFPNQWGLTGPGIGTLSAIRKGDWKLIYYHATGSFELFNITDDIGETTNLVDQEPEKVRELAKVLSDHLRDVEAQMPTYKSSGEVVPWPDEVIAGAISAL
ncbi:sulfatase [Fulvivirgaceae bacterium BMA10]|uniref:Sulfatase n=1 Tax=Splendidivirga corallicola TaxID=3051826 RepID=A0ABT8KNL8_9BACT|nr:sulfatase [Fulvivirgaceae bacterium BMA10]